MGDPDVPRELLDRLRAITAKRARAVIDHIIRHGSVTTEELSTRYGYRHPPRGARDVREQGIPLETFFLKDSKGRRMAAYRFADPAKVRRGMLGGRRVFSKKFKDALMQSAGFRCHICLLPYEDRYLQVDHRVPYEVVGDIPIDERQPHDYMLLCGSCNRAKSWSCEHCPNWKEERNPEICKKCYWAYPESYQHVGLRQLRRLDLVWTEEEIAIYERLVRKAQQSNQQLPDFVKSVLRQVEQE